MDNGDATQGHAMTSAEFAKLMGAYPQPAENPLPAYGGYMDNSPANFSFVNMNDYFGAETFESEPRYSMETVKIWQNLPLNELNKIANKLGTTDPIRIMNHIEDNISNYSAETFEAGNMMVRLQEVDGEAPHYNCPYCRNELTVLGGKGGIVAVCENESRCNGLELPRQFLEDYEKYHWYVNERSSAENFSAEGTLCAVCNGNLDAGWWDCEKCGMIVCGDVDGESGFVECQTLDGMCKDCHPKDENWKMNFGADSDSKNLKMALGITAVGIGLAAVLGKDKIKTLFDRFGL